MYDLYVPMVPEVEYKVSYADAQQQVAQAFAPLGEAYVAVVQRGLSSRWIDIYENEGKRSGAYSWGSYGTNPFMLLNYQNTMDSMFTLAHEMGHSMHTVLSHTSQPFVYAGYTIFVAEVPSTLSEALFLTYMLERTTDEHERIVLLQHAIDGIVTTFYTQVMFADYELQAHRLVEEGKPVTADVLGEIYFGLLQAYHGDAIEYDEQSHVTWARIPHFYSTPYYVYQYATCFASSAQLMKQLTTGSDAQRHDAIARYLTLLKAGGSDHPMTLLKNAGVDLSQPETVQAVVEQLDVLVTQLEHAVSET
jgi:oligoendopeptidase F